MLGTKTYVVPGSKVLIECPHSEVCMHMEIAGRIMHGEFRQTIYPDWTAQSVQLWDPVDGRQFSGPITLGEAGFYREGDEVYVYALTYEECREKDLPMGRKPRFRNV